MAFPQWMIDQRRWLVREFKGDAKIPLSILPSKPDDYRPRKDVESPDYWRTAWNQPCTWSTYDEALAFLAAAPPNKYEGLSFVIHPAGLQESKLIVCFDFDRAFDADGKLWPEVKDTINLFDSCVEISRSGKSLHMFVLVETTPFKNIPQAKVNEVCAVDILCSSQIAVTGNILGGYSELREVPMVLLEALPYFEFRKKDISDDSIPRGFWEGDPTAEISEENIGLIDMMKDWSPAIKGSGRSKQTFSAACTLAREGVTGWEAVRLLEYVPTTPPLTLDELKHKVEDAYRQTHATSSFGENTMGVIDAPDIPAEFLQYASTPPTKTEVGQGEKDYRRVLSAAQWSREVIEQNFLVENAFLGEGAAVIVGEQKTFKTGIAFDLLMSIATSTPFLGQFTTTSPKRCLMLTAEVGDVGIVDLLRRISDNKELVLSAIENLFISGYVPSFTNPNDVVFLKKVLDKFEPDVVCFDPLYFAVGQADVGNMYSMGDILRQISDVCSSRAIWPIFCHHAKKNTDGFRPMTLNDIYGAGVGAFARQWMLLSHAQAYTEGQANLFMKLGGSATGDLKLWDVQIYEGMVDELISERVWQPKVREHDSGLMSTDEEEVLAKLGYDSTKTPEDLKQEFSRWTKKRMTRALQGLSAKQLILSDTQNNYRRRETNETETCRLD